MNLLTEKQIESVKAKVVKKLSSKGDPSPSSESIKEHTQLLTNAEKLYEKYFAPLLSGSPVSFNYLQDVIEYEYWQFSNEHLFSDSDDEESQDYLLKHQKRYLDFFSTYRNDIAKFGVPCKLFITSTQNQSSPFVMKMVSGALTKYGIVHTAIQLGPFLIDWNASSLIKPRSLRTGRKVLAVIDLHVDHKHRKLVPQKDLSSSTKPTIANKEASSLTKEELLETTVDGNLLPSKQLFMQVCKLITHWNSTKSYDNYVSKPTHNSKGNCHSFVEDFMLHFHIPRFPPKTAIGKYLAKIKRKDFDATRKLKNPKVHFTSHSQLDKFYRDQVLTGKVTLREDQIALLKSFDRSFWIMGQVTKNCPFIEELSTTTDPMYILEKDEEKKQISVSEKKKETPTNPFHVTRGIGTEFEDSDSDVSSGGSSSLGSEDLDEIGAELGI